ncbi:MAG: Hsp20/alpha crystallin family protein [Blastocatellia bacterium]
MSKPHRLLSDLAAIERQLNQLFEGSLRGEEQMGSAWSPAVDIYETPTQFVLTAEVPGVNEKEIDIRVVDRNLLLRGERRWERDAQGELFHRLESSYGKFERTFSLSEQIDTERISAEIARGVLTVVLPKRKSQSRKIRIETEDQ